VCYMVRISAVDTLDCHQLITYCLIGILGQKGEEDGLIQYHQSLAEQGTVNPNPITVHCSSRTHFSSFLF